MKFTLILIFGLLLANSCRKETFAPYNSGTYAKETVLGLEDTFKKNGFRLLENKAYMKIFETIQEQTSKVASNEFAKPERSVDWQYWVYPDSINSFLSYVPPKYAIISKGIINEWSNLQIDDFSAFIYHYFGHFEAGHFRKRSEFFLAAEFGGSSLKVAVQYDAKRLIEGFVTVNGGIGNQRRIQPFKLDEEAEAERIAGQAFLNTRKDSLTIFDSWRRITPDKKWGNDVLRIHTGKSKMTNF